MKPSFNLGEAPLYGEKRDCSRTQGFEEGYLVSQGKDRGSYNITDTNFILMYQKFHMLH